MRVPLSLLRNFVPVQVPVDELARVMNGRVSEVEEVERAPSRGTFAGVRGVRLIEALEAQNGHTRWSTDADACIVVGDKFSVQAGGVYAAVLAGSSLPDGTAVGARAVAGLASEGMLCSETHLGIGKEATRPLRIAAETVGSIYDILDLDDTVLSFDLEPNRPDLYSLAGMAHDVAAIWDLPYSEPPRQDLSGLPSLSRPSIDIQTPRARRYEAVLLESVSVGPSPQWLQNAVRKLGMRSINNVVDAANLVMLETGQPLHTFDADRLNAETIVLRMAAPGESITTLDGTSRVLTDECLLVCDGEVPVAIAGIMGDARSEVHAGTTRVLLEGAAFDMASVRRASRRLSLRTEASTRFEKGLPSSGVRPALERLAYLLQQVAGAVPVAAAAAGADVPGETAIPLDRTMICARLGMQLSAARVDSLLRGVGHRIEGDTLFAPEFRPDIRIPEDLIEEVGRLQGYEHVHSEAPAMPLASPRENPVVSTSRRIRRLFNAHGWDEVYLPCWIGDADVDRFGLDRGALVTLLNPIAENYKYFRTTALPALCEAAEQNLKERRQFGIFEVGKVYRRLSTGPIDERAHVSGLSFGSDLLSVRDALLDFARVQGLESQFSRPDHAHLHPGRSVRVGAWAVAGELHPALVRACGFRAAPVVFELDLEQVASSRPAAVRYAPPSRFPTVDLDLNVEVPARVEAASVLAAVPSGELLREAAVVDVYALPAGARITLSFRFGSAERSLALDEANAALDHVRQALRGQGWTAA